VLTEGELSTLVAACREVPLTSSEYVTDNFVLALVETVVDYQMHTTAVEHAMQHFVRDRLDQVLTRDDLEACLARFPDTDEGNVELAVFLWGYRLWTRARQLRRLLDYFDGLGISTIEELRDWARASTFKDFEGRVKGLGPAIYHWLVMRLGVETVKPDVHVLRFVSRAIGRSVSDMEAIAGLEEAARRLGVKANVLDWSIWERERIPQH
jgi:hypothetical protein